jgi:hypothetical protein
MYAAHLSHVCLLILGMAGRISGSRCVVFVCVLYGAGAMCVGHEMCATASIVMYVYMYVYIYMRIYLHICIYIYIYIYIHTYIHTLIYAYIHTYVMYAVFATYIVCVVCSIYFCVRYMRAFSRQTVVTARMYHHDDATCAILCIPQNPYKKSPYACFSCIHT